MPKNPRSILELALIFAALYILTQLGLRTLFPQQFAPKGRMEGVQLRAQDATVKGGHHPVLILANGTDQELSIPGRCPEPPVDVFFVEKDAPEVIIPLEATEAAVPCVPVPPVPTGGEVTIDLAPWKYSLFDRYGVYEVRLKGQSPVVSTRFSVHEPGAATKLFRVFITKPFLNFLVLIASLFPDHNLGFAIIVLTFVVKLLLFFPTQHALEGQREMQKLQPKLEELKRHFAGDPKRLQEETMKLWKEHGVNPFQSCLPMLVQFPVLIGLFYVIRDGSVLALSRHLIYPPYQNLPWTFGTMFLGFDLLQKSTLPMAILLGVLQFLQMKLSFAISERKKVAKGENATPPSQQQIQQRVMLYGLPLMVGFFSIQFPAAVALYWGVSTVFAIGQQWIVNRGS